MPTMPLKFKFYLIVILSCIGSCGLIYTTVIFNNAFEVLNGFINQSFYDQIGRYPSSSEGDICFGVISASPLCGGIIGAAIANVVAERYGRKLGLLIFSLVNIVGSGLSAISSYLNLFEVMLIGRVIQGIAMGVTFCLGSLFIAEVAPTSSRGSALSCMEIVVASSCLLGVVLGSPFALGSAEFLWLLQLIQAVPSMVTLIWLPFCPESPRFLYFNRQDLEKTMESVVFYQSRSGLESTLHDLEDEGNAVDSVVTVTDLLRQPYRRALIVGLVCCVGFCSSGVSVIFTYSNAILQSSGVGSDTASETTIAGLCVAVAITWPLTLIVDRVGRRAILLSGLYGTFTVLLLFTIFHQFSHDTTWAPVLCIIVITTSFVTIITADMVHWYIVAELFDQRSRSKAVALCSVFQWVSEFLAMFIFIPVMGWIGAGYAMLPIAFIALATAVFMSVKMPETRNRTFLEISMATMESNERSVLLPAIDQYSYTC